jgi:hypothetical protein
LEPLRAPQRGCDRRREGDRRREAGQHFARSYFQRAPRRADCEAVVADSQAQAQAQALALAQVLAEQQAAAEAQAQAAECEDGQSLPKRRRTDATAAGAELGWGAAPRQEAQTPAPALGGVEATDVGLPQVAAGGAEPARLPQLAVQAISGPTELSTVGSYPSTTSSAGTPGGLTPAASRFVSTTDGAPHRYFPASSRSVPWHVRAKEALHVSRPVRTMRVQIRPTVSPSAQWQAAELRRMIKLGLYDRALSHRRRPSTWLGEQNAAPQPHLAPPQPHLAPPQPHLAPPQPHLAPPQPHLAPPPGVPAFPASEQGPPTE